MLYQDNSRKFKRPCDSQLKLLEFISHFIEKNSKSPTLLEMSTFTGVASPTSMHNNLRRLQRAGWVTTGGGWRSTKLTELGESMLGYSYLAEEMAIEALDLCA